MKKLLLSLLTLLFCSSLTIVHATDYYVAGTMNGWNTTSNDNKMSLASGTVYSKTFTALSATSYDFKISTYNWGSDWGSSAIDNSQSNVTLGGSGNITFTLATTSDVTFYFNAGTSKIYVQATPAVVPSYTFAAGTTIYYDFTEYGAGVNLFNSDWNNEWKDNVSSIISITLSSAWEITASSSLFKSAASSWNVVTCSTLPTEGQNMLVSADGKTFHWDTYSGGSEPTPSYTFLSGTTIYYDLTEYGSGVNDYKDTWHASTASIISVTLDADWEVTATSQLFRSAASSWSKVSCSTLPTDGQNMIVSTDGATAHWDTYVPPVTPTVSFASLGSKIATGQTIKFAATSTNIDNPSYTFKVKKGSAAYGSAVTQYTFAEAGTYTVKVEADGDDDAHAEATQEVTVGAYNALYYVKTNNWAQVNAHMWGADPSTEWPGALMSLTSATTERNNYPVYSVAYEPAYTSAIFSNNGASQTADLTINASTPYYYNGQWYATLAECDQPVLTTDFYFASSLNDWSTTANRFMKATEEAIEASVTITINAYSDIEFKVVDAGNWRGCNPAKTITKDDRSVTILSDAEGSNVKMTPYAAGDYVFTLNLSTRALTVTYPSGDPMPVPVELYLAGDMNSWSTNNNDYKFVVDEANDVATFTWTAAAAETEYEFKLYNHDWMGANYDFKYYWCTDVAFSLEEGSNAKLYTFKAGTYTFRYKLSTSELTIVYPATSATPITISSVGYATLYSAKALDVPNDVQAYVVSGYQGIKLTMERIYRIPAQTGVLLQAEAGTYNFYEGDGRYIDPVASNLLKGSTAAEEIDNEYVHYVLSYDDSYRVGFFWPTGTGATQGVGAFTNGAGKAYLELSGDQPAGVVARRGFTFTDQTDISTSVEDITDNADGKCVKMLQGGTLLIKRGNQVFNAQGVRVQ